MAMTPTGTLSLSIGTVTIERMPATSAAETGNESPRR